MWQGNTASSAPKRLPGSMKCIKQVCAGLCEIKHCCLVNGRSSRHRAQDNGRQCGRHTSLYCSASHPHTLPLQALSSSQITTGYASETSRGQRNKIDQTADIRWGSSISGQIIFSLDELLIWLLLPEGEGTWMSVNREYIFMLHVQ